METELTQGREQRIEALCRSGWARRDVLRVIDRTFRRVRASEEAVIALLDALAHRPPPAVTEAAAASEMPEGLLARVRALLAKAESTDFDAEAEALNAKAQELITKYRIADAALRVIPRVVSRRVYIDDPYADAKVVLLSRIASTNGASVLWSKRWGMATVLGQPADLDAAELLFTSLLVQATAALRREGRRLDDWGRSRTKRFRRSFLIAFALRIGERLQAAADDTVVAAENAATGGALMPLLGARAAAAEEAARAACPDAGVFAVSANDPEGWYRGREFADAVPLAASPLNGPERLGNTHVLRHGSLARES
ncbi:MAG: DUF2786 domain-containing protein [Actinobacteria bacterium]|nr:DUF2786 domain-containing protein [Actinomycetota bacterium]